MNVLFVASECAPIVKVGGLADVVGSLPKALQELGVTVKIAIPLYKPVIEKYKHLLTRIDIGKVGFSGDTFEYTIFAGQVDGLDILCIGNDEYIGNGEIYPSFGVNSKQSRVAELERFTFFDRAVVDYIVNKSHWMPDVIHAHDWHTGLIPFLIKKNATRRIPIIFTIHNLASQGVSDLSILEKLGYSRTISDGAIQWDALDDNLDLLLQGILSCDILTTVSPTYAEEITTVEFGEGLDKVLMDNRYKLYGVLNGIDNSVWDPENDEKIPVRFNVHNPKDALIAKLKNKAALYEELNIEGVELDKPLIGVVSRLAFQKGFDLLKEIESVLVANDAFSLVVLGTGDPVIEEWFRKWSAESNYIKYIDAFSEEVAHRIYAASDMFLIPSRFEPCGLTQMISMRYGGVPIVRGVGGLNDTVMDNKNGFVFKDYTGNAMWDGIMRAVSAYHDKAVWLPIVTDALKSIFSWDRSAAQYKLLYEKSLPFEKK